MASGFLMVGFSPIADIISSVYGCDTVVVEAMTLLFLIGFIPGNFIVIGTLDKYGLRTCVRLRDFV